jgi:Na+(H+)/acetate symporter ActP
MSGDSSTNWREKGSRLAFSLLAAAVALYFAARLIEAVAPVLIVLTIAGLVLSAAWHIHRARRSGW